MPHTCSWHLADEFFAGLNILKDLLNEFIALIPPFLFISIKKRRSADHSVQFFQRALDLFVILLNLCHFSIYTKNIYKIQEFMRILYYILMPNSMSIFIFYIFAIFVQHMFSSQISTNNKQCRYGFAQCKKPEIVQQIKTNFEGSDYDENSSQENIVKIQEQEQFSEGQLQHSTQKPFLKILKNTKRWIKNYDKEKLVKQRVYEKIRNSANKRLFPELMGPHPIYTKQQWGDNTLQDFQIMNLKQQLFVILKKFWKDLLKKKKQIKQLDDIKLQQEKIEPILKSRGKYKKYSIEFKKKVVKKIQRQMIRQGSNAKSLRHYIVKESKHLNIHPKNITRWIGCDLDRKQGGRIAKYPVLQYKLQQFMKQNPQCQRRIVIEEAKRLKSELGYKQQFNFSKGWFQRFRSRIKQKKVARTIQRLISEQLEKIEQEKIEMNAQKELANMMQIKNEESEINQESQISDD